MRKKTDREREIKNDSASDSWKAVLIQFIKFGLVGVSNTLVSWSCYYLFLWIDEDLYLAGSIVGGIVSIANAFFWNDRYVFKGGKTDWPNRLKRLGKTYVSYGGTAIISIMLIWAEVRVFGINKNFAPPVNLLITVPLNYIINKLWAYKD